MLHTDWSNMYEMSVYDSYTTLIGNICEATDKVAPLKKLLLHCMKHGCIDPY